MTDAHVRGSHAAAVPTYSYIDFQPASGQGTSRPSCLDTPHTTQNPYVLVFGELQSMRGLFVMGRMKKEVICYQLKARRT